MNTLTSAKKNKTLCKWHALEFSECLRELMAMMLSVALVAILLCTLSTPQLAVASECGIVVVQEEEMKQNIRTEVTTALVSLLRATGRQPPAEINNNQSEIELRAEIRKDVNAALEHTIANVTDVCDYKDEFDELKESVNSDELKESVNRELREVKECVNSELREVKESVTRELREVNATMETVIEAAVSTAVEAAVKKATKPIEQLLQSLLNDVALLTQLGHTATHPATSCSEILAAVPSSPSGYYWLRAGDGSSVRVYCDMTRTCGGITGGWMQVANIDMTNSSHTCPQGLNATTHHPIRVCGINVNGRGCSSATFDVHGIEYSQVCGKIIGYQDRSPDGFNTPNRGIDGVYVEGVSLTHGNNPRKHIWTFAAAQSESHNHCPCLNEGTITVPSFVGNDYFCDTGTPVDSNHFHLDDPLWDGRGCGPTSTCCSFNNPPWFSKQLPSPITDDIEMRLCAGNHHAVYNLGDEDVTVQTVELFVQ